MISFGDMLDTIEKNTSQETTVTEKKGVGNVPENKDGESEKEKQGLDESEKEKQELDDPEDVI